MTDLPSTEHLVSYVLHYGSRCRDCADEFGTCPNRGGLPCEVADEKQVITYVIEAIKYGLKHGYIPLEKDKNSEHK